LDATLSIFLIRRSILPKYDGINVIYGPIKDFVEKNTTYKKPVYTLPFNFFDEKQKFKKLKKDEKIKFVVPGLIEVYRRNYDLTINVFENLFEKHNDKITLWLLGKPVGIGGNRIIDRCKKLKDKGYNISFSEEFIPEDRYNKILMDSDVIFSPLNVITKRDTGIQEVYGKTEGSALIFEAIQYCKPLIVPEEFNIIKELKSSTLQYKTKDDLIKIIDDLINRKDKFDKLKKEAYRNSEKFSIPVLQEYFTKEILNKI
jgi:hypothetical protein